MLVAAARAEPEAVSVQRYTVDAAESELLIRTGRSGLLGFAGHRHVIRAERFEGTILWDPAAQAPAGIDVLVDAASLRVVDDDLDSTDVAKVQRDMEERVLETAKHPAVSFTSTSITPAEDSWMVRGRLELHGVAREVELPLTVTRWNDLLQLAGKLTVRQTDHGIEPIRVGLGTVRVSDDVQVELRIEARVTTDLR
jgi:polyisoprenoid-binding protein YceI